MLVMDMVVRMGMRVAVVVMVMVVVTMIMRAMMMVMVAVIVMMRHAGDRGHWLGGLERVDEGAALDPDEASPNAAIRP